MFLVKFSSYVFREFMMTKNNKNKYKCGLRESHRLALLLATALAGLSIIAVLTVFVVSLV